MAKSKRRSRRKDAKKKVAGENIQSDEPSPSKPARIEANPPSANFPLLIISGGLVLGWLIYLFVVAING